MMNDMLPPNRGQSRSGSGYLPRFSQNNGAHHRALPHQAAHPFRTPQAVATREEEQASHNTATELVTPPPKEPPKKKRRSLKEWWHALSKKQKIILSIVTVLVLIGLSAAAYFLFFKSDPAPAVTKKVPAAKREVVPAPTTVPSNLSGLQVGPSVNERPVTAVMIENSLDARPQSGLNQASVVFEAIAEGGITRFTALFQDTEPDYVGPVRSVRPYYLQWIMGFDAAIAHAGGSTEALSNISQWGVKDLNHNGSYFWRVDNRAAPHNLYTSIAKLREYAAQKGFGKSNFTSFARKPENPLKVPDSKSINFNISTANFNVHYDYDAATNSYKRSEGGKAHVDEKSGSQISPKVVVALFMPQGKNGQYTTYNTIGSGTVFVFQDGFAVEGTWQKDSNSKNFTFTGKDGKPLKLNPGQTWITVMGSTTNMSYSP